MELMFTIRPNALLVTSTNSLVVRRTERIFTASTRSICSAVIWSTFPSSKTPALLTRMSSTPNFEKRLIHHLLGTIHRSKITANDCSPAAVRRDLPRNKFSLSSRLVSVHDHSCACLRKLLCDGCADPTRGTSDQRDPIIWVTHFDISDLVLRRGRLFFGRLSFRAMSRKRKAPLQL